MEITKEMAAALIKRADQMRQRSYTPYSHFTVGAALLGTDGVVYTGCNIENAAFGPTNCAERTAIFKAVSEGQREFSAIAIMGAPEGREAEDFCFPCGVCRQVMAEFCDNDFAIFLGKADGTIRKFTLGELLPGAFREDSMK